MTDDVLLNKIATIERCLERVREEYRGDPTRLDSQTVEDAVVLNVQRACEASLDLAMHLVSRRRLGLPQDSRAAFTLLEEAGAIDPDLAARMKRMVGFRNVAVHQYQKLDRSILLRILDERLGTSSSSAGRRALHPTGRPTDDRPR